MQKQKKSNQKNHQDHKIFENAIRKAYQNHIITIHWQFILVIQLWKWKKSNQKNHQDHKILENATRKAYQNHIITSHEFRKSLQCYIRIILNDFAQFNIQLLYWQIANSKI